MKRLLLAGVLSGCLVAAQAKEPVPVGDEFQVNSYTSGYQGRPSVAVDSSGNFVVVWDSPGSYGTDNDWSSVQGQRYDSAGQPVGGESQINTYATSIQYWASVGVDSRGDFVVVWQSWGSQGTDRSASSIQAQRYRASGRPAGGEFQVNTYTTSYQRVPSVAVDPDGDFVVVWESYGSYGTDNDSWSIQGQRFDASGTPVGGEFQVNSATSSYQQRPAVAVDFQSRFVVAWESSYPCSDIQAQRFASDGTPAGSQFQVNTYATGCQLDPSVAVDGAGDFVVAWVSGYSPYPPVGDIRARAFGAQGTPKGNDFLVNTYSTGRQFNPAVSRAANGSFVVVWDSPGSYGTDNSGSSIQGQRYSVRVLFADGFESGDTSAWSAIAP